MAKKLPKSRILKALRDASQNEASAVEFLERRRWGDSPACPRCGSVNVYAMRSKDGGREKHFRWRCREKHPKAMFSVRTGLIFEETRLPLRVWVYAFWKACASKKGISALQIHRECEISYKSALFLMHRIRHAMDADPTANAALAGIVEADETFIGGKPRFRSTKHAAAKSRAGRKQVVFAMVERGGRVKAMHIPRIHKGNLRRELIHNVAVGSRVMTDEAKHYVMVREDFKHETLNHAAGEYVRGDVTTNTVEGFFSLIKRGVYGTFHSVSKHHLHRYVAEFAFRYNHRHMDDGERTLAALEGAAGKRLTYREMVA